MKTKRAKTKRIEPKSQQIAEEIRFDVLSRRFDKGAALREEALAQRFGVSRIPVRDALLQLTQEGLLVAQPNRGVKVAALADDKTQPLIVKLRQEIEEFALNLMFERLDEVPQPHLKRILRNLKAACKTGTASEVVPCDMAFHRFIIDQADCLTLLPIWLPVVSRMMLHYDRLSEWMDSYLEHEAIANAIIAKDLKEARRLLLANIA